MIGKMRKTALAVAVIGVAAWPVAAMAQDAAVVAAIAALNLSVNLSLTTIDGSITAMHTDLARLITENGSAVNEAGSRVSASIEANGNADRSLAIRQGMDARIQDAADSFTVPDSICAESASGGMRAVANAAAGAAGALRGGAGSPASNAAVDRAVNGPAVDASTDSRRVSAVHALYCDKGDFSSYGGTAACPSVSNMPGADKRVDSLLVGAGPDGKDPDLSFTTDQIDAARMYTQNSVYRSVGRTLSKGEAGTPAGTEYVGMRTQYESVLDAAAAPQRALTASRTPNKATAALLKDALQAPSAQSYFNLTASEVARSTGSMSYAEMEAFEVGRRYDNPEYVKDLQAMEGDNLAREQVRVASLNAYLLSELNSKLQLLAVIQGDQLASSAHSEYEPILRAKMHEVDQSMGRAR